MDKSADLQSMTETEFWNWLRAEAYEYGRKHGIPRPNQAESPKPKARSH